MILLLVIIFLNIVFFLYLLFIYDFLYLFFLFERKFRLMVLYLLVGYGVFKYGILLFLEFVFKYKVRNYL